MPLQTFLLPVPGTLRMRRLPSLLLPSPISVSPFPCSCSAFGCWLPISCPANLFCCQLLPSAFATHQMLACYLFLPHPSIAPGWSLLSIFLLSYCVDPLGPLEGTHEVVSLVSSQALRARGWTLGVEGLGQSFFSKHWDWIILYWRGEVLCIVGCLAAPLTSAH